MKFFILNLNIISIYNLSILHYALELRNNPSEKPCEITYPANSEKEFREFLPLEEIKRLFEGGRILPRGQYSTQKLMTYKEYIDSGISSQFDYSIAGNRMVWLLIYKCSEPFNFDGVLIDDIVLTTVMDAETGDGLMGNIRSSDPKFPEILAQNGPPLDKEEFPDELQ